MTDTPTDTAPEAITRDATYFDRVADGLAAAAANAAGFITMWPRCRDLLVADLREAASVHRRLTSHSAGEGLREALDYALPLVKADIDDAMRVRRANRYVIEELERHERTLQSLLTPPSDAGSTTRSGGEGVREAVIAELVEEGRAKHRTLNDEQQDDADSEARAFYRKVIDRYCAALATTPSPDSDLIPVPRDLLAAAAYCARKHAGRDSETYQRLSALSLSTVSQQEAASHD